MEKINEEKLSEVQGGADKVTADPAQGTTKIIENGQVVIIKNGEKYTSSGKTIK